VDNWWRQPIGETRPLTLEMMEEFVDSVLARMEQREKDGPLHLIRGGDWCDLCGPRMWWPKGHPG
jgi:hypothetical protein